MRLLQTSRSTYNSMHQKSSLSPSWKNWYTKSSALSTPLTKSFTSKALGLQRHTLQRKSLKFSKMTTTAIWSNSFKKIARTSLNSNTTQETQTSNTSSTQAQRWRRHFWGIPTSSLSTSAWRRTGSTDRSSSGSVWATPVSRNWWPWPWLSEKKLPSSPVSLAHS